MNNCKEFKALKNLIDYLTAANQIQYYDVIGFPAVYSQDRGRLNIISPTLNYITPSNAIWTKGRGYSRITGSQYFNTGFNPSTAGVKMTKNDCHIAVYLRKNKKEDGASIGVYNGTNDGIWIAPNYGNGNSYTRINAGGSATHVTPITDSRGLSLGVRSSGTQEKFYHDGVLKSTITNNSTNIPNGEIWGLCIHRYSGGPPDDYLPVTNEIAIYSIGTGGLDPVIQKIAFDNALKELGYPVCTDDWFGDSIIQGYLATAGKDFVTLIGEKTRRDFVNNGVGGQTIVQGADDGSSFNKANISTYNSKYSGYLVGGWLRNFWKPYGGGQTPTTTKFTGDLKTNFTDEGVTKGWPKDRIILECGTYVEDNANFTQANYNTFRTALVDFAKQNGFKYFDSYDYMKDRGQGLTINSTDHVHLNDLGNALVFENYMSQQF